MRWEKISTYNKTSQVASHQIYLFHTHKKQKKKNMEKRYNTKHQFPSRFFRKILAISPFNHEKSKTEKRAEPQISSPLESALPPELLLMIINKLDIIDQVCLQSTNRFFHHFIKVDPILLNNKCRKWEIYCRFEQDLDYLPAKLACAFCKTIRKKKCFRDHKEVRLFDFGSLSLRLTHNGKELLPIFNLKDLSLRFRHNFGFERGESRTMLHAPSRLRFCTSHRKLLFSGGPNALPEKSRMRFQTDTVPWPRWTCAQVLRCWHCGLLVPEADLRTRGCLQCLCDVCPRLIWMHYFRVGPCVPNGGGQYKYDLCRKNVWLPGGKHRGKRFVVEVGSEPFHPPLSKTLKARSNVLFNSKGKEPVPIMMPRLTSSGKYAI